VPIEGYLVDCFGPRPVVLAGGVLVGIAWVMNSFADSLALLYIAAAIGGIGAGAVYGTCVGNALKWFPDRRGLAAGLTAAGFGMGSALTIIPIQAIIRADGYQAAFLYFGIAQGLLVFLLSFGLVAPKKGDVAAAAKVIQSPRDYRWSEMIRTPPVFWVM
jgi:OFA family oxalate/formate antiporter-like MFS transporter